MDTYFPQGLWHVWQGSNCQKIHWTYLQAMSLSSRRVHEGISRTRKKAIRTTNTPFALLRETVHWHRKVQSTGKQYSRSKYLNIYIVQNASEKEYGKGVEEGIWYLKGKLKISQKILPSSCDRFNLSIQIRRRLPHSLPRMGYFVT